jgi:hypothetical protein
MALVGAAIVVYRWPWTVVVEWTVLRTTTTYHRAWNGKPVRHGLEVQEQLDTKSAWHRFYDEGELLKEQKFAGEVLKVERNFKNGKRHGPWWSEEEGLRVEGVYDQDREHGLWIYTRDEIRETRFHQGELHRREWRTRAGRVLQSADYEHGRLVKWNDRELTAELHSWVEGNVIDEEERKTLLTPIIDPADGRGQYADFGAENYSVGRSVLSADARPRYLTVQRAGNERKRQVLYIELDGARTGDSLGVALLADALQNSQTFAYRFHTLHIVPINAESLDWQDRTGVYRIRFEPDSQQARAWLEFESASPYMHIGPARRLRAMFGPKDRTGIAIDTTAIDEPVQPDPPGIIMGAMSLSRSLAAFPRRDLLGLHLDREGCYCDQRGNTLIIRRLE